MNANVYIYLKSCVVSPDELAQQWATLPATEQHIATGYHGLRQQQYIHSRYLLRQALSQRHQLDDAQPIPLHYWQLHKTAGRLHTCPTQTPWQISLSHSNDTLAYTLAQSSHLGIDIEHVGRTTHYLVVAKRYFSQAEYQWLLQSEELERAALFWSLWTRKEACIKAWHRGIAHHLAAIEFQPQQTSPVYWPCELPPLTLYHQVVAGWQISVATTLAQPQWHLV